MSHISDIFTFVHFTFRPTIEPTTRHPSLCRGMLALIANIRIGFIVSASFLHITVARHITRI